MAARFSVVLALVAALGFGAATPATAQTAPIDALGAACNANPHFFDFALTGLENDAEGLGRLCSCLVTEFKSYPDKDLVMLTKDLDGSATDADKTAYGDYSGLELKAKSALDKCMVLEGFADGADPGMQTDGPVGAADMTKFTAACADSQIMLIVVGDADGAEERRSTVCGCLVETLKTQISTADADILGQDLDGTATEESRAAYPGYQAIADTAGAAFDSCLAQVDPGPPAAQ